MFPPVRRNIRTYEAGFIVSIIAIATAKGGAGKTTLARLILARAALAGLKAAAVDADFNRTLADWVATVARHPITVRHELDETRIAPLVGELDNAHDVVVVDTAGAASQATLFAIGCADLVLVPVAPSSADVVEAIKTVNLIRSAAQMLRRDVPHRVVLTAVQPGTNVAEHIEREIAKAGLPVLATRLHRLVAFQEMSFTGVAPTTGLAGTQCTNLLKDIVALGGLPKAMKLA
jgi:chromosome partitioning protein